MFSGIQAVFFDLDGTLVDSVPDLAVAVDRMLEQMDMRPRGEEQVRQWVGNGVRNLIRRALANDMAGNVPEVLVEQAWPLFRAAYREHICVGSTLYPGVTSCLDTLQARGLGMACITNKAAEFTQPLLAQIGLAPYFQVVIGNERNLKRKPEPDVLWEAARRLGVDMGRVLMVGDSVNDIGAARNAGCPVVAVPYGYNHGRDIRQENPDAVVETLAQLPALLKAA